MDISHLELFEDETMENQVKETEFKILGMLDFNLNIKTPYDFLWLITSINSGKEFQKVKEKAIFYLEVIQMDPDSRDYSPIVLALACLSSQIK